jgi:hypothetical protein
MRPRRFCSLLSLLTLIMCVPCSAGMVVLDARRTSYLEAELGIYSLVSEGESWTSLDEHAVNLSGESTWLGWHAELESNQISGISPGGMWSQGSSYTWSEGNRSDLYTFVAHAANIWEITFQLDVPTPYEFYLSA